MFCVIVIEVILILCKVFILLTVLNSSSNICGSGVLIFHIFLLQELKPGIRKGKTREQIKSALFRDPNPQEYPQTLSDPMSQGHSSQTNQSQASLQPGVETQPDSVKQPEGAQTLESYLTDQYSSSTPVSQPIAARSDSMVQGSQSNETLQEPMEIDSQNQSEPEAESSVRSSSATDTASEVGTEPSTSGTSSVLVCILDNLILNFPLKSRDVCTWQCQPAVCDCKLYGYSENNNVCNYKVSVWRHFCDMISVTFRCLNHD